MSSAKALPTYPNGFPREILDKFEAATGRKVLCNLPYSGTKVLDDYGKQHLETGDLIVYTSADSVFQIAAHEDLVPVEKLYEYCEIARNILTGDHAVGRVIARPFVGEPGNFTRTSRRHDYSIKPPRKTVLDYTKEAGLETIAVGKINDIYDGQGITDTTRSVSNNDGMEKFTALLDRDFNGIAFLNLVDFDMVYGHRRNIDGYAQAATDFDRGLTAFLPKMKEDDILIITADHGCDPGFTKTTDHTREYVPMLVAGSCVKENNNLGTVLGFGAIGKTICSYLGVPADLAGQDLSDRLLV